MVKRIVTVAAGRVTLGNYVKGVKLAKANPDATFEHGLNNGWPTTGAKIVEEFREGMHDRINRGIPHMERGVV